MATVKFKSNKVLFKADKVSFCAADCTCTDPTGPTPPDPILTTCGACKSGTDCSAYIARGCTPTRLKLVLTEPTHRSSCLTCGDGKSIQWVSGAIAGEYILQQDPTQACRWQLVSTAAPVVVSGFDSGDCSGSPVTATRVTYQVVQSADGYAISVIAGFDAVKGAEFTLFSATVPGLLDSPGSGPVAGDSGFAFECFDYVERGGGRLGTDGTATVTLCPTIAPPSGCDDTPTCITVSGILIPVDLPDFTYDASVLGTAWYVPRTATCTWSSGTISLAGVTNLRIDVIQLDGSDPQTAPLGAGYYLTLSAWDGASAIPQVTYFLQAASSGGYYRNFDNIQDGFPSGLTVSTTCSPGIPSGFCPGMTPRTRVVGFTSVETNLDKHMAECSYGSVVMGDGAPLDIYTLTQDVAIPNRWVYDGPGPGVFVDGVYHSQIHIELLATGTGHTLFALVPGVAFLDPVLFQDDGTNTETSCCAALTFTNTNTAYNCGVAGINGTAYVPPSCIA